MPNLAFYTKAMKEPHPRKPKPIQPMSHAAQSQQFPQKSTHPSCEIQFQQSFLILTILLGWVWRVNQIIFLGFSTAEPLIL